MSSHTLVLTPWMMPHQVIPWERAIQRIYLHKVEVLEEYEESISSPSVTINIPAVVRMKRHVNAHKKGIKFSRINVFTRDHFTCQYCGTQKPMRELNYDHVVPRDLRGKTVWENIVTSCYPCNTLKRNRTPQQAGMRLIKQPVIPKTLPMTSPVISMRSVPELWLPYLGEHPLILLSSKTG